MDLSPGFTDRLMQRIEDHQRQQRLRRSAAFVLSIACLVGGVYAFRGRPADAQRPEVVQRQPKPADAQRREVVQTQPKPADVQRPEVAQTQPSPAAQPPADVLANAGIRPGDLKITIDGRELHGKELQTAIRIGLGKCTPPQVELIRDGKQVSYTVPAAGTGSGPCTAAQPNSH